MQTATLDASLIRQFAISTPNSWTLQPLPPRVAICAKVSRTLDCSTATSASVVIELVAMDRLLNQTATRSALAVHRRFVAAPGGTAFFVRTNNNNNLLRVSYKDFSKYL